MFSFPLRRVLTAALLIGATVSGVTATRTVAAQSVPPSAPPVGVDATRPTVSGILVARPNGRGNHIPPACRTQVSTNAPAMEIRGLVICSTAGRLVLLQLSAQTGFYARYWGRYAVGDLRDGDRINAWGVLQDNGALLNPTFAVQDTDIQEASVDSQDFITQGGRRLTLDVLQSDANGPVHGIIHAVRNGTAHITLCSGQPGNWADLTPGKTVDITHSLFNRRLMSYVDTNTVRVVGC
jgi:hypothetical protein